MPGIVIESSKSVYWPIPKNACTSIKAFIVNQEKVEMINDEIHDAKFNWVDGMIEGYFNWTIIRNPYSRLFSLWKNKIEEGHPLKLDYVDGIDMDVFWNVRHKIYSGMGFKEFVDVILNPGVQPDPHWAPQVGQFPQGAIIFKLEHLSTFLKCILPQFNWSGSQEWIHQYSDSDFQRKVFNYYRADFEMLGYCQ